MRAETLLRWAIRRSKRPVEKVKISSARVYDERIEPDVHQHP